MLPWDAGDKMLFMFLQDELGINLEQTPLDFKIANLGGVFMWIMTWFFKLILALLWGLNQIQISWQLKEHNRPANVH